MNIFVEIKLHKHIIAFYIQDLLYRKYVIYSFVLAREYIIEKCIPQLKTKK